MANLSYRNGDVRQRERPTAINRHALGYGNNPPYAVPCAPPRTVQTYDFTFPPGLRQRELSIIVARSAL